MEVTYTTTVDDYVTWAEHEWRKVRPRWSWLDYVLGRFVPALFLPVLVAVVSGTSGGQPLLIGGAAVVSCFMIVSPLVNWWLTWRRARDEFSDNLRAKKRSLEGRGEIGRLRLVLTDQTLTEWTSEGASVAYWRDMHGVEVAGDYTFVYVTPNSVAIIPRHGFDRDEDYAAVRDFAVAKLGRKS